MIKTIVIVVVVLLALLLIYAAIKPDSFRVERTTAIKAAPEKVFPLINDIHHWEMWSPWEKGDPTIKRTYSGAASGKGAVYEWKSDKQVGQGRMEIIESSPPSKIVLKIDFIKPMEGHNTIDFAIMPQGDTSVVTQAMYGPSPYISRLMTIFFSMDKMIGSKFEEGLANVKTIAEK
jgi:uncharacterized protein YndB with AHSA1/START domain